MSAVENFLYVYNDRQRPVRERLRLLLQDLKALHSLDNESQNFLLENLNLVTNLDKVLYVEILHVLKKYNFLYEILNTGDTELGTLIVRKQWFILSTFNSYSCAHIIHYIFPGLSAITKHQFIQCCRKCIKNEDIGNQFFDHVLQMYGMQMAKYLLITCSVQKLIDVISSNNVAINEKDLVAILKKGLELVSLFVTKQNVCWESLDHKIVIRSLISTYPDLYLSRAYDVPLGARATKRLVCYKPNVIVAHASWFIGRLNPKETIYRLSPENRVIFMKNLCSGKSDCIYPALEPYLKYLPLRARFKVFSTVFNDITGISIWHRSNELEAVLRDVFPIPMQLFFDVGICIADDLPTPNLGTVLNTILSLLVGKSHPQYTIYFLKKLIDIAKYYKAPKVLKETLVYVAFSLEGSYSEKRVFVNYLDSQHDLLNFDAYHWCLVKLILNQIEKNRQETLLLNKIILLKYITYLWAKDEQSETVDCFVYYDTVIIGPNTPRIDAEKGLFNALVNILPLIAKDKNELIELDLNCLVWIIKRNLRNPENTVSFKHYPRLLNSFEYAVMELNSRFNFTYIFKHCSCIFPVDEDSKYFTNIYFTLGINICPEMSIIKWHLENNIQQCLEYRGILMNTLIAIGHKRRNFWNYLKSSDFLQPALDYCMANLESPNAHKALATLLNSTEYLDVAFAYLRELLESERLTEHDKYKKIIIECAKYTKSIDDLAQVMNLSDVSDQGSVFNSVRSLLLYLPERNVDLILNAAIKIPVIENHKVCLYILTKNFVDICNAFRLTDASIANHRKKHVINVAKKYLYKNPSEYFFSLLLHLYTIFAAQNPDFVENVPLLPFTDISLALKGRYLLQLVEGLENFDFSKINEEVALLFLRDRRLLLHTSFDQANSFVYKYFLTGNCKFSINLLFNIVVQYLCYLDYDIGTKFHSVFRKLQAHLVAKRHDAVEVEVKRFLEIVFSNIWMILQLNQPIKHGGVDLLEKLRDCILYYLPKKDFKIVYIKINILLLLYRTSSMDQRVVGMTFTLEHLNQNLTSFIDELAALFVDMLAQDSRETMPTYLYYFCKALRDFNRSTKCALFILKLLPRHPPSDAEVLTEYNQLIGSLRLERDNNVVQELQNHLATCNVTSS